MRVAVTGGRGNLGSALVKALRERGTPAEPIDTAECDVTNYWQLWKFGQSFLDDYPCSGLVCLHGLDAPPTTDDSDPWRDWQDFLDVNLTGTMHACRVFGEHMVKHGGGSIVTTASLYGLVAPDQRLYQADCCDVTASWWDNNGNHGEQRVEHWPCETFVKPAGYAVSKAAVIGLTRYLAALWGKDGVRVNCIAPGGVWTPETPSGFHQRYTDRVPLGRMAEPSDVVGAVLWLLSDESRYVTGQVIAVDGGYTTL